SSVGRINGSSTASLWQPRTLGVSLRYDFSALTHSLPHA
ncbi:hypothetical protein, partial [Pseudomonas aeruginosa]